MLKKQPKQYLEPVLLKKDKYDSYNSNISISPFDVAEEVNGEGIEQVRKEGFA